MSRTASRRKVATVLALSMVTQVAETRASEPPAPTLVKTLPPAAEAAPRVGLRVDAEGLGSGGDPVKAKIEETAKEVFAAEGFEGASGERDPVIVVVVERTGTEENPGFVVGYSLEKGEEVVAGSARQSDCSLCTRTELLERIRAELPGLLKLAREQQEAVEAGGEEGEVTDSGEAGEEEEGGGEGREEVKPIGPLGFAGIGLGVVGLAGVGVGVAYAVKGFEPVDETGWDRINYRTPGNIVLSIGGAALIAGVVMIAVDVSKRKKQRKAGKSESSLRVEPRGAGFAF